MAVYKSAMGKVVDMTTIISKNEKVRAVGNMSVNARGDTIDSNGRVVTPVTEKVNNMYSQTVGNKSAQVRRRPTQPAPAPAPEFELNEIERELEDSADSDMEIERIKAAEKKVKK